MTNLRPFVTGSRAYGIPASDSDIDLVLYLDEEDVKELQLQADPITEEDAEVAALYGLAHTISLRFGNLNMICTTDVAVFEADPHGFSTRPCATCQNITRLLGRSFGCSARADGTMQGNRRTE